MIRTTALPPVAKAVLRSPGERLPHATVARLHQQLGHDFSAVRVHHDDRSPRALGARGFATGEHVVLGDRSPRLLAHELAHVAQQRAAGPAGGDCEARARSAAATVAAGGSVSPAQLGAAPAGVHLDDEPAPNQPLRIDWPPLALSWDQVLRTPPPRLTLAGTGPFTAPPPPFLTTLTAPTFIRPLGTPPTPALTPPPAASTTTAPSPSAPSRLSVADSGRLSLGLRLGFPALEDQPNLPPSAAAAALQNAQVSAQLLSGKIPSSWEALDKAKLAGALWGIFSTNIAPDFARKVASAVSGKRRSGVSYELDAVLLTDFSGGGLSFTVKLP